MKGALSFAGQTRAIYGAGKLQRPVPPLSSDLEGRSTLIGRGRFIVRVGEAAIDDPQSKKDFGHVRR